MMIIFLILVNFPYICVNRIDEDTQSMGCHAEIATINTHVYI